MASGKIIAGFFKYAFDLIAAAVGLYAVLLALLTIPIFQSHVVYLHAFQMTWFKDLNVPRILASSGIKSLRSQLGHLTANVCTLGTFFQ